MVLKTESKGTLGEAISPVLLSGYRKAPGMSRGGKLPELPATVPRPHLISRGDWSILAREGISNLTNSAPCRLELARPARQQAELHGASPAGVLPGNPTRWQTAPCRCSFKIRNPTTVASGTFPPVPCWSPSKTPSTDGAWLPASPLAPLPSPPASNGISKPRFPCRGA